MIDLEPSAMIVLCACIWTGLIVLAVWRLSDTAHGTTGLPFALIGIYTAMHIGALVHLVPGYDHTLDPYLESWRFTRETVALGVEASTLAMLAATLGIGLCDVALREERRVGPLSSGQVAWLQRNGRVLLVLGVAGLLIEKAIDYAGFALPGLQAVLSNVRNLLVTGGACLVLHEVLAGNGVKALLFTGLFAVIIPITFLVTTALLGDSINAGLASFAFYLTTGAKGRKLFTRNLGVVACFGLSAFVFSAGYLENRDQLRALMWGGKGTVEAAVGTVADAAGRYDVSRSTQSAALNAYDYRLNQNIFIGLAIEKLRNLPDTYENGDTILMAFAGWVPRFLWPEKPERGGSSMIIKHTGKTTDGETTFGAGPIFEFYVNFAYAGVFFGFMSLAYLMRLVDIWAARGLKRGDAGEFAQYYLPGVTLLQPLADLFFVVTSFVTALLLGWAIRTYLSRSRPHRVTA